MISYLFISSLMNKLPKFCKVCSDINAGRMIQAGDTGPFLSFTSWITCSVQGTMKPNLFVWPELVRIVLEK